MKLDAKAFLRADKNKTKVDDFPERKKVKKLANVAETLITKKKGDKRIRITAGTSKYVDKSTGEVKDINKSLINQSNGQVSATQNAFGIHIEKTLNSNTGVLFDDGFHKVNMFPILSNGKTAIGEVDSKHSNKILFKDFVENDTLEYIVQENGLKENIIIPCMRDAYSYKFKLLLDNLEAEFNDNAVHFFDSETNEKIFVMGIFMYDQAGERSKSIDMQLKSNTKLDYDLTITPNVKWINSDKRKFPVTIDPQIQVVDTPVLSLTGYRSGYQSPAINNKLVLGIKDSAEHKLKLALDTESIVSELVRNNIQKYNVTIELHYLTGKRLDTSKGFVIYNNSTLLMKDLMKNENNTLSIDVTSLVEAEMEKYQKGRDLSKINLQICYADAHTNVSSDGTSSGINITDDYVYLLDRFYDDTSMRPEIQLDYVKKDEVVEGTPFLEYENGKSGKTAINIFNKSLSHTLKLGSIEANALKIDVGLHYDSRLKKEMNEQNKVGLFGKGWMLNVNQRLIKGTDYNKLLGTKDVIYIDGKNNPHTLREKWYYEKDGVRHYILKDLVYIDNDQKMKYLDEETSTIFEVDYEVTSDEGLSLISTNSKMNYVKKSDMKINRKYYILLSGNKKVEVSMANGYLRIPMFYKTKSEWVKIEATSKTGLVSEEVLKRFTFSTEAIDSVVRAKVVNRCVYRKEFVSYQNVRTTNNSYKDLNGNTLSLDYFSRQLYFKDGFFYVKGLKSKYKLETENNKMEEYFEDYENESYDIPVIIEKEYFVDRSQPLADYYENEDIAKINSQIQQIEDYLDDLKFQAKSACNSVHRIEVEINHQKLLRSKNLDINAMRDAATEQNYLAYPPQIYEYEGSDKKEETGKTCANELSRELQKLQTQFSDDYQTENYRYQIATLKAQLEEQQISLDKSYKKIADYETQLANLKEQKEALVVEQKKGVQDYIIDKSGNILGFSYYGKLVYITDSYENEIVLNYDENKLIDISSKTQKMYFDYNEDDFVSSIVDAQGRRKECIYENGVLSKIRFVAENNKKQDIEFKYSLSHDLWKIIDASGICLNAYPDENNGFRIVQETTTESISTKEVKSLKTSIKYVDVLLQINESKNYSVVIDNLNNIRTTHYYDYSGKLLHSFEEDLDTKKKSSTHIHYENQNKQYEVSFKEEKKFKSFNLGREINKRFTAVLNLTSAEKASKLHTTLNPDTIPTCKFAFARLDLRNLSQQKWLSLNQITLKAIVCGPTGKRVYISTFSNLSPQIIGIPFTFSSKDKEVRVSITCRKSINLETIKTMDFFEAEGTFATYDSDDKLVKTEDGTTTTLYEGFVDDKPTRSITIDEFGERRTSYVSYDSKGRVVFEEDHLRNCKETFYDEKGNVVETREYNKECPTLAKVSKTKYDEQGNATTIDGIMRDENGNYPQQEVSYLPNTSKVVSTKSASGQVMCYGYDYNTDDLLEIASDAKGQGNSTRMKYRFGLLTSLTHHGFTIDYTLDGQGRKTGIAVAGKTLLTNEYTDQFSNEKVTRGSKVTTKTLDGFESTTIKDKEGKLVSTTTNENDQIIYTYDEEDQLVEVKNLSTNELAHTDYNAKGLVVKNKTVIDGIIVESVNTYDDKDLVVSTTTTFGDKSSTTEFKYDKVHGDRIYETLVDGDLKQSIEYDALSRVTKKTLSSKDNVLIEDEYEYVQYGENSLDLIKEHNVKVGGKLLDTVSYTYDVAGNITNVIRDEYKTRYAYDHLNRLVREDNPRLNQTIVYKYDNGGNILLKKIYPYTLDQEVFGGEMCHYTYSSGSWKDQLVDFNGQAITYDEMGRPVQIGDTPLLWNKKGQLVSYGTNKYTYNLNGIRTSKIVNGVKTDYYLSGNKILREMSNEKDIIYHYAMEKLVGFLYNDVEYIYERNIQGDILGIYKKDDLTKVAEYVYDAYGNHKVINYTVNNIGDINPIRYRGYYFDTETKLYYLNSRYYNPEFGRFISPDTLSILDETKAQINGLNLYMYCADNPVMKVDPSGMAWWDVLATVLGSIVSAAAIVIGVALVTTGIGGPAGAILISAGVSSMVSGYTNLNSGGTFLAGWVGGAVGGAIAGVFPLGIGRIFGNTVGAFVTSLIIDGIDIGVGVKTKNPVDIFKDAGISAGVSFISSILIGGTFDGAIQSLGKEAIEQLSKGAIGVTMQLFYTLCNITGTIFGNTFSKKKE